MNLVKNNSNNRIAIYANNGELQGYTDEGLYITFNGKIYEMYYTAWGWVIRIGEDTETGKLKWLYMSKSYKGKYEYRLDHSWAKTIKTKKTAWNHLLNIARLNGAPV